MCACTVGCVWCAPRRGCGGVAPLCGVNAGVSGLYSGLKPNLIGVFPEKALKLSVNDTVREVRAGVRVGVLRPHVFGARGRTLLAQARSPGGVLSCACAVLYSLEWRWKD